jgi:hypothetical protein
MQRSLAVLCWCLVAYLALGSRWRRSKQFL